MLAPSTTLQAKLQVLVPHGLWPWSPQGCPPSPALVALSWAAAASSGPLQRGCVGTGSPCPLTHPSCAVPSPTPALTEGPCMPQGKSEEQITLDLFVELTDQAIDTGIRSTQRRNGQVHCQYGTLWLLPADLWAPSSMHSAAEAGASASRSRPLSLKWGQKRCHRGTPWFSW